MTRRNIKQLRDLPNIGPAAERDLKLLGITQPDQLAGRDPYQMYAALCQASGRQHDPCVIDVLLSAVRYMEGQPARKWWAYSAERKKHLSHD